MYDCPEVPARKQPSSDEPEDQYGPPDWLPLMRRLTQVCESWGVWKNADSALIGRGDVDSLCIANERPAALLEFTSWASDRGYGPVFTCDHLPTPLIALAVDRQRLIQFDLWGYAVFRGAPMFVAEDLMPLMSMDERGFRRLRTGAEGLFLLLLNGTRHGGRPRPADIAAKRIIELLNEDWGGVEAASGFFGRAGSSCLRLAKAATNGGWDRRSAVEVEAWAIQRAIRQPRMLASRARFRTTARWRCPVLSTLTHGRTISMDPSDWILKVRESHPIHEIA